MPTHSAETYRRIAAEARQEILDTYDAKGPGPAARRWGLRLSAELAVTKAMLLDAGAHTRAIGLYYHNQRLAARLVDTPFGSRWMLRRDEAKRFGRKYIPFDGKGTSRIQKRFHMTERPETVPVWARLAGMDSGLGPDDCATAHIEIYRSGDPWGRDAKPCAHEI